MKNQINEFQQSDWFLLPKYLLTGYGHILGCPGVAVYGYLAAISNEVYECKYNSYKIAESLKLRERKVEKILRKLEQLKLIKVRHIGSCQLLWLPWG